MPDDAREIINSAPEYTPPPSGDDDDGLPQRDRLILCAMRGELWHDPDHVAYATIEVDGHFESFAVRSSAYKRHLLKTYGARYQQVIDDGGTKITIPGSPSSQALSDALNAIEAKAGIGPEKVPAVRVSKILSTGPHQNKYLRGQHKPCCGKNDRMDQGE